MTIVKSLIALGCLLVASHSVLAQQLSTKLNFADGTAYTVGTAPTVLLLTGGDNDSNNSNGGRSFGGHGVVHLTPSQNAFAIYESNYINGQGMLSGNMAAVMFLMPGDLSKSTILGGGYPGGTITGVASNLNPSTNPYSIKNQVYVSPPAAGGFPATTTLTFSSPLAITSGSGENFVYYRTTKTTSMRDAGPATLTGYSFTSFMPPGELLVNWATQAYADLVPHSTRNGLSFVASVTTITGYGQEVAPNTPLGTFYILSPPTNFGAMPSGNPLGGVDQSWVTTDRTKSINGGHLPWGTLYYVWNQSAQTVTLICDNTNWYGYAEIVGTYPTPPGWNGDLAWFDNMGQYSDSSDGWQYGAFQTTSGPYQPAPPAGAISASAPEVKAKGKVNISWQIQ